MKTTEEVMIRDSNGEETHHVSPEVLAHVYWELANDRIRPPKTKATMKTTDTQEIKAIKARLGWIESILNKHLDADGGAKANNGVVTEESELWDRANRIGRPSDRHRTRHCVRGIPGIQGTDEDAVAQCNHDFQRNPLLQKNDLKCVKCGVYMDERYNRPDISGTEENTPEFRAVLPRLGKLEHNMRIVQGMINTILEDINSGARLALVY